MAGFMHKDFTPCVKLIGTPFTQTAIDKGYCVEYKPLATISETGLEFDISGNEEDYIDLSVFLPIVKVKNITIDKSDLGMKTPAVPVNLFLSVLFSEIDVNLNKRVISSAINTYYIIT